MLDLTDWQSNKYQLRRGEKIRILCIDAPGEEPIIGCHDNGVPISRSISGRWYTSINEDSGLDLINAKTRKEGWANVYRNGLDPDDWHDEVCRVRVYASKEEADEKATSSGRLACVKIEWEE